MSMCFRYFIVISPRKRALHLNKLESPSPKDALCQVLLNWPSGSFVIISPWESALHLNKLESPSPKDALYQVWLKLAQWFLRRFLNFVNVFMPFNNIPIGKEQGPLSEQTWITIIQGCFVPILDEIGPEVFEKILKFHQCVFAIS